MRALYKLSGNQVQSIINNTIIKPFFLNTGNINRQTYFNRFMLEALIEYDYEVTLVFYTQSIKKSNTIKSCAYMTIKGVYSHDFVLDFKYNLKDQKGSINSVQYYTTIQDAINTINYSPITTILEQYLSKNNPTKQKIKKDFVKHIKNYTHKFENSWVDITDI